MFNRKKDLIFYRIMTDITANIGEAAQLFYENVETLSDKEEYAEKIKTLESKGDDYTHLLIKELNQTFVTPLDHEDLLTLAKDLDDIIDGIEACAARFVYMHVEKPTPYLLQFADLLRTGAQLIQEAFIGLEKRNYTQIRKISVEVNILENEGDKILRESISSLFEEPVDLVNLIKMKEIYEKLEAVTDTYEDLMDVLESVVMKYA
ncbi:DUF47 family protein [Hazenella sp. IB182353]|uniref:DUF47 domain-containing protein n=1 Tax=Polycladospora coralii TaxID=2771432 RepID=UPI0017465C6D|nr:DUF47 family protein [Polycladospora coralii]MBS7531724.1 DUF47 family protein [Polycladospora coralii]